jgi:hypothetical protein
MARLQCRLVTRADPFTALDHLASPADSSAPGPASANSVSCASSLLGAIFDPFDFFDLCDKHLRTWEIRSEKGACRQAGGRNTTGVNSFSSAFLFSLLTSFVLAVFLSSEFYVND